MIRNYFKIAWRNLLRNKGFSITNILGLAIGMTCTLLIFLWVRDELNFNKFHRNYDNIYQVIAHRDFKNQIFTDRNMVLPLAQTVEQKFKEIEHAVVMTYPQPHVLQVGESKIKKSGYNVSEHFFNVFTWNFVKGNAASAINDPSSIVLTESTAKALFGDQDPINKVVRIDNNLNAKVSAIVKDPLPNSTFIFDFIQPFNYSDPGIKQSMNDWQNSSWNVFLQLQPGTNLAQLEKKINQLKNERDPGDAVSTYFVFPMSKWRLYSDFKDGKNAGGMIDYVRLFIIIALGILLIACVNFMNLSTARSEKRSKEVGIRKTLGSDRKQLVLQFFCESMILAFIAFGLALISTYFLMPAFNKLVNKELSIFISSSTFWLLAFAVVLFTGLVAGSYPALYLSSFNPVRVLKGAYSSGKSGVLPRRILVVGQFVMSILLISGTLIIYQQIQHVKKREIGYDPNNLIMVPTTGDINRNFSSIKQELLNTGQVSAVTKASAPVTEIWWKSSSPDYEGKPANTEIIFTGLAMDVDFLKTVGINLAEGRDFTGAPADSAHMLLNRAAIVAMDIKNPVGMKMRYGGREYTVLGITDNVIMESPYMPVGPMMMFFNPNFSSTLSIRLNPGVNPRTALPAIESIFKKFNPAFPFDYRFADEEFGKKFVSEELVNRITNIFAFLAIFICCIGLAGLASFTIEKRTRELGIRKVLGASVAQLLALISKEFMQLVAIAFLIAVPVTWWVMNDWLGNYTYHVQIGVGLFAIVGILVLLLTLAVVGLNTLAAARENPVKSLRTE